MATTKKKTVKKAAPKAASKAAPKVVPAAVEPAGCQCKRHGCWKKILIFVLGIIVGAAACCTMCCHKKGGFGKKMWFRKHAEFQNKFVNGCLDLSKIECQDKIEEIKLKDANGDGCITNEEFFGKPAMPEGKRPMRRQRMRR